MSNEFKTSETFVSRIKRELSEFMDLWRENKLIAVYVVGLILLLLVWIILPRLPIGFAPGGPAPNVPQSPPAHSSSGEKKESPQSPKSANLELSPPAESPKLTTLSKLPVYKAIASSEFDSRRSANKVLDGRTGTHSWVYSWWTRRGETTGAWIELVMDRSCIVEEIAYFISFERTQSQIRRASIAFDDGSVQKIHFERKQDWRRVPLQPMRSERVRITVDDVFPNGSENQLQVIEIELRGRDCL